MAATSNSFLSTIKSYDAFLGHSGFGIVLRGTDTSQKTTAIKFLFPPKDDSKERKRIVTECNITKSLKHENIVNIINFEEKQFKPEELQEILNLLPQDDDQLLSKGETYLRIARRHGALDVICIQSELCGENLRSWLQNEKDRNDIFVQLKQVEITQNLISGLAYLHTNKILHRDLKPENIMFSKGKFQLPVKIGDFGLCRKIHSPESQTSLLTIGAGTPNYMAPEVRARNDYYQADLYSLGLIIWEIVQVIETKNIISKFEALTIDKDEEVVHEHASLIGVKQLIIDLTKRVVKERIQNIAEVVEISKVWRHFLVDKKEMNPKNGQELELCLKYAPVRCVINLMEGEYEGHFFIKQDNVKISGMGATTVIKYSENDYTDSDNDICLVIDGNGCKIENVDIITAIEISGIRLIGRKNTIQNVNFTNCDCCVYVDSNDNQIENLTMSNSKRGMYIFGSNNSINQIKTENVDEGLDIASNHNTVSNWKSENVKEFGISVWGSDNKLSNISLTKNSESVECYGVNIESDANNIVVDNLSCVGYNRDSDDWGVRIRGDSITLKDSKCGSVWVTEGNHITLTTVDGGELIEFDDGTIGLTLINCKATKLKCKSNIKSFKMEGCSFGSFE